MGISSGLGNALVPTSYGFRNEIINGNFMINQRAYASGANLASGAYGFDRWKSNFTNTALTFTSAPQGQTVTISASGVVRQIVERANVVAGSYVLSWFGTATGRVYNDGSTPPSYQSGPLSVVLDGTANVIVEFTPASGTATLGNVQLEFGSRTTPFEHRPIGVELALCQRYFTRLGTNQTGVTNLMGGVMETTTGFCVIEPALVEMRNRPVASFSGSISWFNAAGSGQTPTITGQRSSNNTFCFIGTVPVATTAGQGGSLYTLGPGYIDFNAEL
jgi:hypothetical protein